MFPATFEIVRAVRHRKWVWYEISNFAFTFKLYENWNCMLPHFWW